MSANNDASLPPYVLPHYTREWIYTFLILVAAFTAYFRFQHPPLSKLALSQAAAPVAQESYWFFALQLPNPKSNYSPSEFHQKTTDWFNTLRRAGFRPMLLSEVRTRLTKGMLLPDKTIVFSIDEALLNTYQAYAPILKDFGYPVTLVTSTKPLKEGDRGYLSLNAVQKLPTSGLWDVILMDDHAQPQLLSIQDIPEVLPVPPGISPWASESDHSMANQLIDLQRPHRLFIDWSWTGQDLMHRLEVETPIHPHGSHLGARLILDHLWGVVLAQAPSADDRFSLHAAMDQRGADIGWMGTRGVENFLLHFSIDDVTGQVWFLLRSTGDKGSSIRVGFLDGKVMVKEVHAGKEHLLGLTDWPRVFPWTGRIELRGTELRVIQKDQSVIVCRVSPPVKSSHPSPALLQMLVYDQLYGGAQARNVSLEMTPLLSLDSSSPDETL